MLKRLISTALCAAMIASGGVCAMAADGSSTAALAASFSDVAAGSWYESAVSYVNEKGLFSGTGSDTFSPNVNMSRGMFVTVLGRAAGVSATDAASGFSDVDAGKYYAPYIKWAADNKIVTGVGGGKFSPEADVDREQMCAIIVRYLRDYKKLDLSAYTTGSVDFSDASSISSWALADVNTAQKLGFVQGSYVNGKLVFNPKGKTTRAAAAAVFQRFDQNVSKIEKGEVVTPEPVTPPNTENGGSAGGSGSAGGGGGAVTPDKDKHTAEEIAEEKEVAGYLQNMSTNYKSSAYATTVAKPVKEAMDLLINTIDKILAQRQNGVFISSEYIKTNYSAEIEEFRTKYHALTSDQLNQMQNLAIRIETEAHIYYVLDYFGVKQADI